MAVTYLKGSSGDTLQWQGNLTVDGTQVFTGGTSYAGDVTLGDAVADSAILKGRLATGTAAGTALAIDATTYQYANGAYLRYNVADWADTYTLTEFGALYARAETNEANASGFLYGATVYGVANNVGVQHLKGVLSYAYIKGTTAKTVATAYGVQAELTWDAGAAATTITTELTPLMAKITGGAADDYTKIHGVIVRAGDMDGASRTYGNGILIQDDAALAGAITWTKGISIANACTTGISIEGATSFGVEITGSSTVAFDCRTGTFGTGISLAGTLTTGVFVGACTTGASFAGAMTTGVDMSGAITTGINVAGSAMTTGISVGLTGKTYTTGIAVGVTGATLTTGLVTAGTVTTGVSFGATTANHIVFATVGTGTDGNLIKGGTSGSPLSCGTTADTSFVKLYTKSTATTGDARGIYNRLYIGGAGGSGESLRSFTTVEAGISAATVHGSHLSLSFADATASVTGLAVAMRATLHVPNGAVTAGTRAAVQAEIFTDGASADIAGQLVSAFRVVVDGSEGTGKTNADTNAYFLDLSGVTEGATGFIDTDITTGTHHSGLRVRMPDGTTKWIAIISA